jgi:transcriptional regulator with XRE-family HTH domain
MQIGITREAATVVHEPFTWSEGSELVNELGNEKWLGQRIQTERKVRGWSQAKLSDKLAKAGHPLHQSAISKIEPPDEDKRGGRPRGAVSGKRSVTIDEAVGFSKVFKIPLGELLLPPDAVRDAAAWRRYLRAAELQNGIRDLRGQLEDEIFWSRPAFAASEPLRRRLREHSQEVRRKVTAELQESTERDGTEPFGSEALEAAMPPAVTVADDILRTEEP